MTKIINLFGGPGVSKSTTASQIFADLKWKNINCEMVREYAKEKVWENSMDLLDNQLYVFSKQYHRQFVLRDKVDIVITDSPLLLSMVYGKNKTDLFHQLVLERFNEYDNMNFYLIRNKPYHESGRYQTESQAKVLDKIILDILINNNIKFTMIDGDEEAYKKILELI